VLLVNLLPELFAAQRIAFFGRNVYILYVLEIAQNFRFLLLFCKLSEAGKTLDYQINTSINRHSARQ
jgi:hypothetical protein